VAQIITAAQSVVILHAQTY